MFLDVQLSQEFSQAAIDGTNCTFPARSLLCLATQGFSVKVEVCIVDVAGEKVGVAA